MFDHKVFLKTVASAPGVYQMLDKSGQLLYVGKAKNLKKRLTSYFRKDLKDLKTLALVGQIATIQTIITSTENEALLLENNLIKQHRPRYNILFRDDKSYPYIYLSADEFPRISLYRGAKKEKGSYFGPYPAGGIARETVNLLQKLFLLRSCKNSYFKSRSRPCLQYQINRCSAPCVGLITKADYANNVALVEQFLKGKYPAVMENIIQRMEQAAQQLDYETAAIQRDQIKLLQQLQLQSEQYSQYGQGNVDVIVLVQKHNLICIDLLMIRNGQLLGNKHFLKTIIGEINPAELVAAFIAQYYLNAETFIPAEIIMNVKPADWKLLTQALTERVKKQVQIKINVARQRKEWLKMAIVNAESVLQAHLQSEQSLYKQFQDLQQLLALAELPRQIECFDISHTSGVATIASCVVFSVTGPQKNSYRRFNITGITAQDDFAALRQAIKRRYEKNLAQHKPMPDILMIDGGRGQLQQAETVFTELGITNVILLSIAKGEKRKPGLETIYQAGRFLPLNVENHGLAFQLLLQIRDEAHRFAITSHRNKRSQNNRRSVLENIPGVGKKRRTQLLKYFGGLQEIQQASVNTLMQVPGINKEVAQRIYAYFKTSNI